MTTDLPNDDDLDLGGDYARERGWSGGGRRDEYTRGPHLYQAPDEQIREEVSNALALDDLVDATHIEVKVDGAIVTLTGFVATDSERRGAEDCARRAGGVQDVRNALRVSRGDHEVAIGKASE
jgi:osmotically-inducible protein OsmY